MYTPLPEEPPLWLTCLSWGASLIGGFLMVVVFPTIFILLLVGLGFEP